jgi:hypothetical protein
VVKGFLYLCLSYAAVTVFTTLAYVSSQEAGTWVLSLLTPVGAFINPEVRGLAFPAATYVGMALQTGLIGVVLLAISSRLQRPTQAPAVA